MLHSTRLGYSLYVLIPTVLLRVPWNDGGVSEWDGPTGNGHVGWAVLGDKILYGVSRAVGAYSLFRRCVGDLYMGL